MAEDHKLLLDDPWTVDPANFPSLDTTEKKLLFLLNYAVLAPSILNTQPWRFRVTNTAMELFIDRTRLLPVTDPAGRELTISCGAALLNIRVALRGFGYECETELLPGVHVRDLLARVMLSVPKQASESDEQLRNAITSRRTNRGELLDRSLPSELMNALSAAVMLEGSTLEIAPDRSVKETVAELVSEAHANLSANPDYRREIGDWIRYRINEAVAQSNPSTSIAGRTPGLPTQPELRAPSAASAARMFSRNREVLERLSHQLTAAPIIALLTTSDDGPKDWIMAGQGLQRALLEATANGACASFLNAPIEVPSLRLKLAEVFGTRAIPQILLRFGYGAEVSPEPRRPVTAVLHS